MAQDQVTIDQGTAFDNVDERQVEFAGEVDGDRYRFALRYDVLEALSGAAPDVDAIPLFRRHADRIGTIAARALARDIDQELVVVSENDLD